jgi:hypothetical protein
MEKDMAIKELLRWLHQQLGNRFAVTDHWEDDLCAIGISSPEDPPQLVYILSFGQPARQHKVELESAPFPGSDLPFRTVGRFELVRRENLLAIIKDHLQLSN